MNYITLELKTNDEGGTAAEVLYSGIDRRVAEQQYHATLATAATSGRLCHAAIILQGDGTPLEYMAYTRETSEEGAE